MDWELFHFLRPWWLLALIPVVYVLWRLSRAHKQANNWSQVCDAHLLKHLLQQSRAHKRHWPLWLFALASLCVVFALAGPTWSRLPQPLVQSQVARVIVFDLSESMLATDIKPSRLLRAKYKLMDLLKYSREGQTGLVVFAGQAYVVSPLTHDSHTIMALVPQLAPSIMPTQGQDINDALQLAADLLQQAQMAPGDIILISDSTPSTVAYRTAERLAAQGNHLSVLAIGTELGSPIPKTKGGFVQDSNGAIVLAKLDTEALRRLAIAGQGQYIAFSHDNHDIDTLINTLQQQMQRQALQDEAMTERWHDQGRWFLMPVLLLALLVFRRGWLEAVLT
jgi:Ca-activated chloride channel homolog